MVRGLISSKGTAAGVIDAALAGRFVLVTSYALLEELFEVLRRPRIREKYHINEERLSGLLNILGFAEIVPGIPRTRLVEADPDDDWVVAPALEAGADVIVTEDKELLEMREYERVSFVTSAEFLRRLERTG